MIIDLGNGFRFDSDNLALIPVDATYEPTDSETGSVWSPKAGTYGSEPPSISGIGICVNKNCNLRCRYCSEHSGEGRDCIDVGSVISFLDEALVKHLLEHDTLVPLRVGITGGGEPTYDMGLFRSIIGAIQTCCSEAEIPVSFSLTTNGTLDDREDIQFIAKNIQNILVSYDGLPELQDMRRPFPDGSGSSSKVRGFIKTLISMGCRLRIRTTVRPRDLNRLPEMLDDLYELTHLEIEDWSIYPEMPIGRSAGSCDVGELRSNPFYPAYMNLRSIAMERFGFNRISTPIISLRPIHCYCGGLVTDKTGLWLMPPGVVHTCLDYRKEPIAVVRDGRVTYKAEYTDDLMVEYSKQYGSKRCQTCIAYHVCRGGCPAKSLTLPKDYLEWECECECDAWADLLRDLCDGQFRNGWSTKEDGGILRMSYQSDPEEGPFREDHRVFRPTVNRSVLALPDRKIVLNESATLIFKHIKEKGIENVNDDSIFDVIQSHYPDESLNRDVVVSDADSIIRFFRESDVI